MNGWINRKREGERERGGGVTGGLLSSGEMDARGRDSELLLFLSGGRGQGGGGGGGGAGDQAAFEESAARHRINVTLSPCMYMSVDTRAHVCEDRRTCAAGSYLS